MPEPKPLQTIKRGRTTYKTDGLGYQFGGAALDRYNRLNDAIYSHALDFEAEKVVCGKAKFHMFLDDDTIADEEPTCPHCRTALGLPDREAQAECDAQAEAAKK